MGRDPGPEPYALRIRTRGLAPARHLKAIIDGGSAALQHGISTGQVGIGVARLETLLGVRADELSDLITAPGSPLGVAVKLFTVDGSVQMRVTPDDDRCIAAEVVAVSDDEPACLSVDLHLARWR